MPVLKKNGQIRVCGDYKVTANKALLTESYPLPRVDELVAALAGGKTFTKLDLSNAYLQLPLDEPSKEYLVINTHKVQQVAFWCEFCSSNIPAAHGHTSTRPARSLCLYR